MGVNENGDVIINPLWPTFCSLMGNDLDAATKTAIKAAWGDRGGNLSF